MKCHFLGCVTFKFDPMSGQKVWLNFCPRCHKMLDIAA